MDKETEKKNISFYKYSEKGIKTRNFELWSNISNYLSIDITFKEKFFLYENDLSHPPVCYCGNVVGFLDMFRGYRKFCSNKCMLSSKEVKQSRKETCLKKYGVDNPSKSEFIKDKVKKTNLSKFGVEYPLQSKQIISSLKEKFMQKWGVDNPSKVSEIRKKAKDTIFRKYGVEHAMHNLEIQENLKSHFVKKFGVTNPSKLSQIRDKAKKTMLSKYGSENALELDIFKKKSRNTNLQRFGKEFYTQTDRYKESLKKTIFDKNSEIINTEVYELILVSSSEYQINCKKCGLNFTINRQLWRSRFRNDQECCIICNPIFNGTSKEEKVLCDFIKQNYSGEIIENYKTKKELDIYLPELKIGFEYNGLYWHSEANKSKQEHVEKYRYFKKIGIDFFSFWEDDWNFKKEIVKSIIVNKLGATQNRIFARKCKVVEVEDNSLIRDFLEKNHMQGFVGSKIKFGLFHNGELVSLMVFGSLRKSLGQNSKDGYFEMLRFCNKINTIVIGGASKLFKAFLWRYNPVEVISFSDNSRTTGNMYQQLGFILESETFGNYFWYKDSIKHHRFTFRKDKLVKLGYDANKTEVQIMHEIGYLRIWDYGQKKWVFKP